MWTWCVRNTPAKPIFIPHYPISSISLYIISCYQSQDFSIFLSVGFVFLLQKHLFGEMKYTVYVSFLRLLFSRHCTRHFRFQKWWIEILFKSKIPFKFILMFPVPSSKKIYEIKKCNWSILLSDIYFDCVDCCIYVSCKYRPWTNMIRHSECSKLLKDRLKEIFHEKNQLRKISQRKSR